jgi:hypothetical protein
VVIEGHDLHITDMTSPGATHDKNLYATSAYEAKSVQTGLQRKINENTRGCQVHTVGIVVCLCLWGCGACNRKRTYKEKKSEAAKKKTILKQPGSFLSHTLQHVCERASMMRKKN